MNFLIYSSLIKLRYLIFRRMDKIIITSVNNRFALIKHWCGTGNTAQNNCPVGAYCVEPPNISCSCVRPSVRPSVRLSVRHAFSSSRPSSSSSDQLHADQSDYARWLMVWMVGLVGFNRSRSPGTWVLHLGKISNAKCKWVPGEPRRHCRCIFGFFPCSSVDGDMV